MRETTLESQITSSITSKTMENSHTPTVVSPADTRTPPLATNKRNQLNGQTTNGAERAGSEPVDPTALSKALKSMEDAGGVRERTPGASPSRKRQRVYGDRLVNSFSFPPQEGRWGLIYRGTTALVSGSIGYNMIRSIECGLN